MHSCFPFRSVSRQATHHGGDGIGGVTVVSRGEGSVKIVVSRDELECIAAGVTRRQCGAAAPRRRLHVAESAVEQQPSRAHERDHHPLRRRRPEAEAGAAVRRGEWLPALGGIPEEET